MMTSCPSNFTMTSIKWRCESSNEAFRDGSGGGANKKILIPVTDVQNGITYGNEYCAVCNGVYDYQFWNISAHCSPAKSFTADSTEFPLRSIVSDLQEKISPPPPPPVSPNQISTTTKDEVDNGGDTHRQNFYSEELLEEVKKRIKYDVNAKAFVSSYDGIHYDCWYSRVKPAHVIPHVRYCVEYASEAGCVFDRDKLTEAERRCLSYTSIVYDGYGRAYRNADCAATCNGKFGPEVGPLKHCIWWQS